MADGVFDEGTYGTELGYLTTTGRTSGLPRTVEIWFAGFGRTVYLLADTRTNWVSNILVDPRVRFRIGDEELPGRGRIVVDPGEHERVGGLIVAKYQAGYEEDLFRWQVEGIPVAVDFGLQDEAED